MNYLIRELKQDENEVLDSVVRFTVLIGHV